ncbi:DUF1707 domain-containing protein [Pseudonocardia sp. GCM10023141]|uniref:DUF1707 domain-containing protein n=1 Tax=Pseudonocardia sp. GCM10023141 TaxID=3252653 RepID=UPI0036197379
MSTFEVPPIRIGNDERQAAVQALGEHYGQGRLESDEFDERVAAAYAARTHVELDILFADLPRPSTSGPVPALPPPPVMLAPPWHQMPTAVVPAPYGIEPHTGMPYSDRSKVAAGVLQILLPFGVGRFYSGHIGMGIAQLVLSFIGIGVLWSFLDGILILLGRPIDPYGRPLRP